MWGLTPWDNFNPLSFTLSEMHCLAGIYSPATGQKKKKTQSFYFHFFVITLCPLPELHKEAFCRVTAGVSCGPESHVCVSLGAATPTMSRRGAGAGASGCGTHMLTYKAHFPPTRISVFIDHSVILKGKQLYSHCQWQDSPGEQGQASL